MHCRIGQSLNHIRTFERSKNIKFWWWWWLRALLRQPSSLESDPHTDLFIIVLKGIQGSLFHVGPESLLSVHTQARDPIDCNRLSWSHSHGKINLLIIWVSFAQNQFWLHARPYTWIHFSWPDLIFKELYWQLIQVIDFSKQSKHVCVRASLHSLTVGVLDMIGLAGKFVR